MQRNATQCKAVQRQAMRTKSNARLSNAKQNNLRQRMPLHIFLKNRETSNWGGAGFIINLETYFVAVGKYLFKKRNTCMRQAFHSPAAMLPFPHLAIDRWQGGMCGWLRPPQRRRGTSLVFALNNGFKTSKKKKHSKQIEKPYKKLPNPRSRHVPPNIVGKLRPRGGSLCMTVISFNICQDIKNQL